MRTFMFCCAGSHNATEKEFIIMLTSLPEISDYQLSFAKHLCS